MKNQISNQKNMLLGLFAIAIWAFAALLAVELTSIPPFELLFFEFFIAFLVVLARYSFSKEKTAFFNFSILDLFIVSAVLILNQICYYTAFRHAPAAQVDLINYLWPTMLILFSSFLPKEKFSFSYLIACGICIWGIYNLLSPDYSQGFLSQNFTGYSLAFGAAISWTAYCVYARYRRADSANCISWACGPAAIFGVITHLYCEVWIMPSTYEMTLILVLGVFQMGLAFYFWEKAIQNGCVKFLGLASYSIPVMSVMILVLFGKAEFERKMIIATFMISSAPLVPLLRSRWKAGRFFLSKSAKAVSVEP